MHQDNNHYFSSDWHLDHHNILKYDDRPFKDVFHMNQVILNNYNHKVTSKDNFYYLGDFCFNTKNTEHYLSQMNGNKFFIKGNHDKKDTIKLYEKYGTYLGELCEIEIYKQKIVLCHYAMKVWNKSHRGSWHLYGHSHHSLLDDKHSLSFDIGINGHNYEVLEFKEIEKIMNNKEFKPLDHHE